MLRNQWYAIQKDRTDGWDNGSYNYQDAIKILKNQGHGLIAVIDENTGCCIEEITFEELFN